MPGPLSVPLLKLPPPSVSVTPWLTSTPPLLLICNTPTEMLAVTAAAFLVTMAVSAAPGRPADQLPALLKSPSLSAFVNVVVADDAANVSTNAGTERQNT